MSALKFRSLLLCVALSACSSTPTDPAADPAVDPLTLATLGVPPKAPSLVGVVVELTPDRRVLLEHRPVRPECQRRALASLGPQTRIVRRSGASATDKDLQPGTSVSAWFGDVELRSCPVQVEALAIVIE